MFGNDSIKRYIPRIWRNFLDFLAIEGNANQLWAKPDLSVAEVCKTAVVITAAHSDAIAIAVESNGRCDDDVETSRVEQ